MIPITESVFESTKQKVGVQVADAIVFWSDKCAEGLSDQFKIKFTRDEKNYIVLDFLIYFIHALESLLDFKLEDDEKKNEVIDYINNLLSPIIKRDYLTEMENGEIVRYIFNGNKEYGDYFVNLMEAGSSIDSHFENLLSSNISIRLNNPEIGLIQISKSLIEIINNNMKYNILESFVDRLSGGNGTTIVPGKLIEQWNIVMDTSDYFAKYRELNSATLLLGQDAAPLFRGITSLASTLPHPKAGIIQAFVTIIDAIKKGQIELPLNYGKDQWLNSAEVLMVSVHGAREDCLQDYEMHSKIAGNLLADYKILFDEKEKIKFDYYFDKRLFPLTTNDDLSRSIQIREDEKLYDTLYGQVKKTNSISMNNHFILMELIVKNAFREISKEQ